MFRLGQALFFDKELSGNRNISCGTCHVPFLTTSELLPLSLGEGAVGVGPNRRKETGKIIARNSQDLFLKTDVGTFFWDGRVERGTNGALIGPVAAPPGLSGALAFASILPLLDRDEMRGQLVTNRLATVSDSRPDVVWELIVERLLEFPAYRDLFLSAAPEDVPSIALVGNALAEFQNTLWGTDVADPTSFRFAAQRSEAASRGFRLFLGEGGCFRCHQSLTSPNPQFHNIGVPQFGPGIEQSGLDLGREEATGHAADRFKFRTPSLANVAMTPPYMHNGAFATLRAAVEHHFDPIESLFSYEGEFLPPTIRATLVQDPEILDEIAATLEPSEIAPLRPLSESELDDLLAFLRALTGPSELVKDVSEGVPNSVPSGLPIDNWAERSHPLR